MGEKRETSSEGDLSLSSTPSGISASALHSESRRSVGGLCISHSAETITHLEWPVWVTVSVSGVSFIYRNFILVECMFCLRRRCVNLSIE